MVWQWWRWLWRHKTFQPPCCLLKEWIIRVYSLWSIPWLPTTILRCMWYRCYHHSALSAGAVAVLIYPTVPLLWFIYLLCMIYGCGCVSACFTHFTLSYVELLCAETMSRARHFMNERCNIIFIHDAIHKSKALSQFWISRKLEWMPKVLKVKNR